MIEEFWNRKAFKGTIAKRLIVAFVLFSTLISLVTTGVQLYADYRDGLIGIKDDFSLINSSHLKSLSNSLWAFDEQNIKTGLEGMLKLPNMEYVAVRVDGKILWSAGEQWSQNVKSRVFPIRVMYRGKEQIIGMLEVYASLTSLYQQLWNKALVILLGNSIKTFLVVGFVFILFHRLVTRRLDRLMKFVRQLDINTSDHKSVHNLAPPPADTPDEIDELCASILGMHEQQKDLYQSLVDNEEQQAQLLGSMGEAMYGVDRAGNCTFSNSACLQALGYQTSDDLLGLSMHSITHARGPDGLPIPVNECDICQAYIHSETVHAVEQIFWRKDGTSFPAECRAYPIYADGAVKGSVVTFSDVSTSVLANKELTLAKDEAEKANLAKSEFLSSMSHELRTPMNAILGFGQMLELNLKEPLTEQQKNCVNHIMVGGEHLLGLIDQVLDLAKIESGKLSLSLEKVDLADICRECLALVDRQAMDRGLDVVFDMKTKYAIEADYSRFKQVLLNLLSNAVKYNRKGGRLVLACKDVADNKVRVSVTDTGDGIAEGEQHKLFEPFNRLGKEAGKIEGTGIGLTITKRLVEAMGCVIDFESEVGVGSTFWVECPKSKRLEGKDMELGSIQKKNILQESLSGNATVLYVEDNPANMQLMDVIFKGMDNVSLLQAESAEIGLGVADEQSPDLILMDLNLPGMSGFEALHALKKNDKTRDIPVIAVTARAMKKDIAQGVSAGFKSYITKPFDVPKLVELIKIELNP